MNDFESLMFYIISFCCSSMIISTVGKKYRNKENDYNEKFKIIFLTLLGLIIPILIGSFRYFVGTDYRAYLNIYEKTHNYSLIDIFMEKKEVLFLIIIKIASLFSNSQVIFAIMSFLTITTLYFTILNYKEKLSLGFMFFLYLFMYFTSSFNLVKQSLAVVLVAYSYRFIFERNMKKFVIFILIASLFHISALFFLPFYFIFSKSDHKNKKLIRLIYILITIVIILNYQVVIKLVTNISIFEEYQTYQNELNSANREVILEFAVLAIILLFRKPLIKYDERNEIFIFLSIINCLLLLTGYISPYIKRIAAYFGISNIFLLSSLPNLFKDRKQKFFIYSLISIYAILRFVIVVFILKQSNIIPYQTIFINL